MLAGYIYLASDHSKSCARRLNLVATAFGCIFSMIMERVYHIWSPSYRRGRDIEDPIHFQPNDETKLDEKTEDLIKKHQKADERGERWWQFIWPYSTHENFHGAAVNGILAGETSWSIQLSFCKVSPRTVGPCYSCHACFRLGQVMQFARRPHERTRYRVEC